MVIPPHTISRRDFLRTSLLGGLCLWGATETRASEKEPAGWPSEFGEYRDAITGARVRMLTQSKADDTVIYQTHPMWTAGMKHLLFRSDRAGYAAPHALDMETGRIHVVTDSSVGTYVLASLENRVYYLSEGSVFTIGVIDSLEAKEKVAAIPDWAAGLRGGPEMSPDANGKALYVGGTLEKDKKWGILRLDLVTQSWHVVTEQDFRIGHVQANPYRSGVVMFCHETGGDAPQRTWVIQDGEKEPRPMYKETYGEWVTHEVWWGPDRAVFTIWPYDDEHKQETHGILSADLATGQPTLHSQYRAWHTHASPDRQWILGDDFDRNIWLVRADTGERRLLTQGHLGEGCGTHPHASFTTDSKSVVFNSSRNGTEDIFLAEIPEDWESLPLPEDVEKDGS